MREIDVWFRIWARLARQVEDVGYPSRNILYTSPRTGETYDPPDPLEEADYQRGLQVAAIMEQIARDNRRDYQVVRLYMGAFPNAPDKPDRMKLLQQISVSERQAYDIVRRVKDQVYGAIMYAGA